MSDNKRTVDDIRNEYGQLCAKVGHAHYQAYVLEKDIELMNETLRSLNQEAAKLNAEAAVAQSATPAPAEAPLEAASV